MSHMKQLAEAQGSAKTDVRFIKKSQKRKCKFCGGNHPWGKVTGPVSARRGTRMTANRHPRRKTTRRGNQRTNPNLRGNLSINRTTSLVLRKLTPTIRTVIATRTMNTSMSASLRSALIVLQPKIRRNLSPSTSTLGGSSRPT